MFGFIAEEIITSSSVTACPKQECNDNVDVVGTIAFASSKMKYFYIFLLIEVTFLTYIVKSLDGVTLVLVIPTDNSL